MRLDSVIAPTVLLFGLHSPTVFAAEVAPWGVGVRLGTVVVPGYMPVQFPKVVREDTLEDGSPALGGTRGDVIVGVNAVYYAGHAWRVGLLGDLGFGGNRYFNADLIFHYDHALASFEGLDFLAGAGLGVGSMRFGSDTDALLKVPYYAGRVEASVISHQGMFAVQASSFARVNLPTNQSYTSSTGAESDAPGGLYLTFGVDLTFFVGDRLGR